VQRRWLKALRAEEALTQKYSSSNPPTTETRRLARVSQFFLASPDSFQGKSVLDVGCGYNGLIFYLNMAGFRVGLEPLAFQIKDLCPVPNKQAVSIVCGVGEALPFREDTFDIVICDNALDHGMSPRAWIREIKRCLKPGGVLYMRVNTFDSPIVPGKVLSWLDTPHPYHFSDKQVQALLRGEGLQIEHHIIQDLTFHSAVVEKLKLKRPFSALKFMGALVLGLKYSYFVAKKHSNYSK